MVVGIISPPPPTREGYMSFISKDSFTSCLKFSDKFLHFMAGFAGIVFLGFYTQWGFLKVLGMVMAVLIIFETIQGILYLFFKAMDGFSYRDIIADFIGCILAWAWIKNTKNIWIFIAILGIYIYVEGIPKLRGQR